MECAEIRSELVAGRVPAGPTVEQHLVSCASCRDLFADDALLGRRLAEAVLPAPEPGDLLQTLERSLAREQGLRATLRAWPTGVRAGVLVGSALLLLVSQLLVSRRADFAGYSQPMFWGLALVLLLGLASGAWSLARGPSTPLAGARRVSWRSGLLLLLPALTALWSPFGVDLKLLKSSVAFRPLHGAGAEAEVVWGNPGACFVYGAVLVIPLLLLTWLFERRTVVPVSALVAAGALAGLAANLLLHAHCPSPHFGHLLVGHASIGVAWALGLGLFSGRLQRAE